MKTEKAVLISIRPKWCEKIASGEKIIEVRKTRPKLQPPFKCYIYCTKGGVALGAWGKHGKVIGEFTCDGIYKLETRSPGESYFVAGEGKPTTNRVARESCLGLADMHRYLQSKTGYGWHISGLEIYDAPKELVEFESLYECDECGAKWASECNACRDNRKIKREPRSWCYVENMEG
nr:MAG TPA: hypothetical protein [Caudoviricetes sp.]